MIMEKIINKILSNELLVITFTLLIFAMIDVNRWFYLLAPIVTYFVIFVMQLTSVFIEVYRNEKARN